MDIHSLLMLVAFVDIASTRICLPDFQQGIAHRVAPVVENAPGDDDALANRFAVFGGVARQVVVERLNRILAEDGRGEFGQRVRQEQQRLLWGAFDR